MNKGYGFVEYSHNYEKTKQACNLLDGKRMGSCTLHCEFIKETIVTFEQLNSSCLFVDHLPPNYDDTEEFTKIFSSVNKPIYCRVWLKCLLCKLIDSLQTMLRLIEFYQNKPSILLANYVTWYVTFYLKF
jgi:hypothetical protein